ncbi:hypothetical protein BDZ91DRAFT_724334 [Kalaharituber pfeilii]|nr:hypothetical protein BDZ91DRAFT_724334 [Kalaharituber pfeilii]
MSSVKLHTWQERNPDNTPIHKTQTIQSQLPLPSFAFALTGIDATPAPIVQLSASAAWVQENCSPAFDAILDSGSDPMKTASCNFLEISANHPVLRTGTYNITGPLTGTKEIPIEFPEPFTTKAKVIVFVNSIQFQGDHDYNIWLDATNVTENGFHIKVELWTDEVILGLDVTWIAYPEGTPGITSGYVNTNQFRTIRDDPTQHDNAWYESLVGQDFQTTPTIFFGFNSFKFGTGRNLRVQSMIWKSDQYGFLWGANTSGDTLMYRIYLGYVAFDPSI